MDFPTDPEVRSEVINSFNKENSYYYHEKHDDVGYKYDGGFKDGLAWTSVALGAALLVKDEEVVNLTKGYITNMLAMSDKGSDVRNYAPVNAGSKWVESPTHPGFWYYKEDQSFAGPAGLKFANNCGAGIPDNMFDIMGKAKSMVLTGFAFGILARQFKYFRQHLDSMFLAYLILRKKPSSTMLWACEENPYFSYIAGKTTPLEIQYPPARRTASGTESMRKELVSFKKAEPSAWPFRRDPFVEYVPGGDPLNRAYTRIWRLVGDYLQASLRWQSPV